MLNFASLETIKRHWFVVVVLTLLGGVAAFGISSLMTPLYRSTASLFFTLNFGNTANDLAQGSTYTSNQMLSFGELAVSPVVLDPVIRDLHLNMTSEELRRSITVSTPRDTVIMDLSVASSDPQRSAQIANAVAAQAIIVVEEFAPRQQDGSSTVTVRNIKQAVPPQYQFSPDKKTNTALGMFAGLMAGILAAFMLAALDNRVRGEKSLEQVGEVTYLGSLRHRPHSGGQEAVVLQQPTSVPAEEYRQLRSALRYATMSKHPLTVVISSSTPEEGKSTVSLNLASIIAESGQRVLLIEADLRRPRQADYANLDGTMGVSDVLVGNATLATTIQPVGSSGLDILPAGATPPNPGELLGSKQMSELLAQVRNEYDTVIIDTAPVLAVADPVALGHEADGLILVARANITRKRDLQRSLETVVAAGIPLFGAVLNGTKASGGQELHYYSPRRSAPIRFEEPVTAGEPVTAKTSD